MKTYFFYIYDFDDSSSILPVLRFQYFFQDRIAPFKCFRRLMNGKLLTVWKRQGFEVTWSQYIRNERNLIEKRDIRRRHEADKQQDNPFLHTDKFVYFWRNQFSSLRLRFTVFNRRSYMRLFRSWFISPA